MYRYLSRSGIILFEKKKELYKNRNIKMFFVDIAIENTL